MFIEIWHSLSFKNGESIPEWHCPGCLRGVLESTSREYLSWDNWFSGLLKCSQCNEQVFFAGKVIVEYSGYYPSLSDYFHEEYIDVYHPMYFNPTIPVFTIPANCPARIKDMIEDCFVTLWLSPFLCVAKIREVIQQVLEINQQSKTYPVKKLVTLRKRILFYKSINADVAKDLLATPWLFKDPINNKKVEKKELVRVLSKLEGVVNSFY